MSKINQVLVIDDDPDAIEYIECLINSLGITCEVKGALNGQIALKSLKKDGVPDLIFLDINMPVMNGWEFLKNYNSLPDHERAIFITMLTVSQNSDDKAKAEKLGLSFISKPLKPELLKKLLVESA